MGIYYMYKCDNCGYSFRAYEGYGRAGFLSYYSQERMKALNGKMGEEFKTLMQNPKASLDISRKLVRCDHCKTCAFEPVDALYIMPEDYEMTPAESDAGEQSDGDTYYYAPLDDMKSCGTLAAETGCRCSECGGVMTVLSDYMPDILDCPNCDGIMHQVFGGFFE